MNARSRRRGGAAMNEAAAKVRVYRQGIGDCILVTLPRKDGTPFHILIDCGVMMVTKDKKAKLTAVIDDIAAATDGAIDVLVVTHEHYDHVVGFQLVPGVFDKLKVSAVWTAWTEDPDDCLAKELRERHANAFALLEQSFGALNAAGAGEEAKRLASAAAGAAPGSDPETGDLGADNIFAAVRVSTKSAKDAALACIEPRDPDYLDPHTLAPLPDDVEATIYVLGPPKDEAKLNRSDPSTDAPETFGLAEALAAAGATMSGADANAGNFPFNEMLKIPLDVAREMDFFEDHYFKGFSKVDIRKRRERNAAAEGDSERRGEPVLDDTDGDVKWRSIDGAAFARAQDLALHLEKHTNNTSLAFAIKLKTDDVLLFPGDAQVGNSLSWHDADFADGDDTVTTESLLGRTVFYKVSHHGSHNGTLREKGLGMMRALRFAAITISEADARKLGWDRMPLAELVAAIEEEVAHRDGAVVRTDTEVVHPDVRKEPLFYEFSF